MLFAFIFIILMAPWYQISYTPSDNPHKTLEAVFSLLLISFTTHDKSTGQTLYYKIWSIEFWSVCGKCDDGTIDPDYVDDCDQVESFCDDTNETLTNVFLWIVSSPLQPC